MNWYRLASTVPWISLVLAIPALGALLVLLTPSRARTAIRWFGILAAVVTFGLVLALIGGFQHGVAGLQFDERYPWIPGIGISYHVGVDGLSIFLLGLNGLLYLLALLAADRTMPRFKEFVILLLTMSTATAGVLVSLDLILFYVFWEGMLVPLYFLIGAWGEGRRVYAAFKFVIYTVFGSFAMLVSILATAGIAFSQTGQLSFDWTYLLQHPAGGAVQDLLFLGFALAFAIKMPIFPFHTWLPAAYTATPIPALIVFAGLVSKLGAYGFLRFNLALFPHGARTWGPVLAVLATAGILYAAFMALIQRDMKTLVAYASMSHVNFIGLGIFAGNVLGVEGALIQMVNHGLIIAALFLLVGMLELRTGTRDRSLLRGLTKRAPIFAGLFFLAALAALGLPGLNSFVGEFFIMLGAWSAFLPLAVAAGVAVVLAAWYVLRFYQGAFEEAPARPEAFPDMRFADVGILSPLALLIIVLGVVPVFFVAAVESTVRALPVIAR
jgi:NADH-quinone oxidoreductase subunit M